MGRRSAAPHQTQVEIKFPSPNIDNKILITNQSLNVVFGEGAQRAGGVGCKILPWLN